MGLRSCTQPVTLGMLKTVVKVSKIDIVVKQSPNVISVV